MSWFGWGNKEDKKVDVKQKEVEEVDRDAHLNIDEEKVAELLAIMKEKYPVEDGQYRSELMYRRFIIGRSYNIEDSCQFFENFEVWRTNLGDVTLEGLDHILQWGCIYFHGYSKLGSPIMIIKASKMLPKKVSPEELVRFNTYIIENLIAYSPTNKYCILVDFSGFGYSNFSYDKLNPLIELWNKYFPEAVEREFFINSHWIFRKIWNMVRGMIDPRTVQKIRFLTDNWKEELLEFVEPGDLQEEYGGTSDFLYEGYENATPEDPKWNLESFNNNNNDDNNNNN
eukprot:TRINITY_DN663_c0_g1_i1.p1 TRINITY_DN663_c0_g1~~TRINITY_DN663_c0_g1_i1.p1  ORF type:complete len:294 (-),score=103.49 TRINITY_DN663_c0_g1_i1:189-1040(-)